MVTNADVYEMFPGGVRYQGSLGDWGKESRDHVTRAQILGQLLIPL